MENQKIVVVQVPINDLKPAEYNPRKADEKANKQLKDSISQFGLIDPIIANIAPERKNIVIGGHFRLRMAKELGFKEVPVIYLNIPEIDKEMELNIRLNKNSGEWDYNLLANFDDSMLGKVGFSKEEMDTLFGLDLEDKDDSFFEGVYELGPHKIICDGNPRVKELVKILEESNACVIFTSPKNAEILVNRWEKKTGEIAIKL